MTSLSQNHNLLRHRNINKHKHKQQLPQPSLSSSPSIFKPFLISLLILLTFLLVILIFYKNDSKSLPLLPQSTSPDNELLLTNHTIPLESHQPPSKSLLTCIPTVTRAEGSIEYISNTVKSFRLATNNTSLHKLLVFDMDHPPSENPIWLNSVFPDWKPTHNLPSWLEVIHRESPVVPPQKATLGDSWGRVVWRSKEARDYAEVLRRCAAQAEGRFIMLVQDDVLFHPEIAQVPQWAEKWFRDDVVVSAGRTKVRRVCSASLFDAFGGVDGAELSASNMVARVWEVARVEAAVKYLERNFEEMPVDWLVDRLCKSQRRRTLVMWPNPVRHRGKVSSFEGNVDREGMVT